MLSQAPHETSVAIRTLLSYRRGLKGREFMKRVSEWGAARAVPVRVEAKRGTGSPITRYSGSRGQSRSRAPQKSVSEIHQIGFSG